MSQCKQIYGISLLTDKKERGIEWMWKTKCEKVYAQMIYKTNISESRTHTFNMGSSLGSSS